MGAVKATLLAGAALAGAAGLGGELLLLSAAGLAMGYGSASALGLAAWIGAWALGAWVAGRWPWGARSGLLCTGLAAGAGAPLAFLALLALGRLPLGDGAARGLGVLAIAGAALPQGFFLPLLARAWDPPAGGARDVSPLFAANLAGAVLGARAVGFDLAAAHGRIPAAWTAGALALAAGLLAGLRVGRGALPAPPRVSPGVSSGGRASPASGLSPAGAGLILGLGTAWLAGVEWVGFRLGALWLGGMQQALSAVLVASLLALAAGAALLPALLPRDSRGVLGAVLLGTAGCLWTVAGPGAGILDAPWERPVLAMLALVGPPLFALGALVPCLHRCLTGESGARLGGLLLHEVWGASIGVPLVHWWLVPNLGSGGASAALSLVTLLVTLALVGARAGTARRWALAGLPLGAAAVAWTALAPEPALRTPQLADPAFQRLFFAEDEDFAVTVVDDGVLGQRTLLTDAFRATAVGDDYLYMRVLGHLPVLLHPAPRRVGVLAFGTGTTAGAVSLHPQVEHLDVLELSRAVIEAAPLFEDVNHGVLEREEVAVHLGDGRRTLARLSGTLDVLTMEPLLPDSPFAVYLYTREFYRRARRSLAPGGLLCQWVPPHALAPATFDALIDAFARAFPWSAVFLFGTQVILLGGEAEPSLSAARFPDGGSDPPGDGSGDLRRALAELGLAEPAGLMARFVTSGAGWPPAPRPLTDADPWVIYAERLRGANLLAVLPTNLRTLREREQEPPLAWLLSAGPRGPELLEAVRTLHRAREAWRWWELERLTGPGGPGPDPGPDPELDSHGAYRAAIPAPLADDPEVRQFDRQVRFYGARLGGVLDLARGEDRRAFASLTLAASLRPERADVHLFVALAALGSGQPGVARRAASRAYELCPRLLETPQGRKALELGLPLELRPAPAAGGRENDAPDPP